jgi:hypothetical protein
MLEITGAAPGSQCDQDWPAIWSASSERKAVKDELAQMKEMISVQSLNGDDPSALQPFAASFWSQLYAVLQRVFQQYWRTPSYLYSKVALSLLSVSPPCALSCQDNPADQRYTGIVHRVFILEDTQLFTRFAESVVCRLHAA